MQIATRLANGNTLINNWMKLLERKDRPCHRAGAGVGGDPGEKGRLGAAVLDAAGEPWAGDDDSDYR